MGTTGKTVTTRSNFVDAFGGRLPIDPNYDDSTEGLENRLDDLMKDNEFGWSKTNPLYFVNPRFRNNCGLTTTAFALAMRGYDVEAMPRDTDKSTGWRSIDSIFDIDYTNTDNYMCGSGKTHWRGVASVQQVKRDTGLTEDQIPKAGRGSQKVSEQIIEKVKKWGSGAYGIINVGWPTGSGHILIIANVRNNVVIYDPQDGEKHSSVKHYLENTVANQTAIARLDNATIKSSITDDTLRKMVKKRSTKEEIVEAKKRGR